MNVRTRLLGLLAVVSVLAGLLPLTAVAHHTNDGGVDEAWSNDMNQESYWEARFGSDTREVSCTAYKKHNGYIPAEYDAAVVKDGTMVRVYADLTSVGAFTALGAVNPANNKHFKAPHSWVMKCKFKDAPPPEIDYCDARNKPSGDLGAWLAQNGNPDCIDIEVIPGCGMVTGSITRNDTNWNTWAVAFEIAPATYAGWTTGSMSFPEDHNGGSVEVAYYLVGPEGDYGVISGEPNFWAQSAATITVDTDCEDEVEVCEEGTDREGEPVGDEPCDEETTTTTSSTTSTTSTTVVDSTTTTVPTTTESTLPFTGIEDFYLPTALALVLAGGLVLALGRKPEEDDIN